MIVYTLEETKPKYVCCTLTGFILLPSIFAQVFNFPFPLTNFTYLFYLMAILIHEYGVCVIYR